MVHKVRSCVVVLALLACAGAAEGATGRPDLRPTSASYAVRQPLGEFWASRTMPVSIDWQQQTRNIGSAASPASRTAIRLAGGSAPAGRLDSMRVPRLGANQSAEGEDRFSLDVSQSAYGTHQVQVCADAKNAIQESREGNNCTRLHPLYLVPFQLEGRVSGAIVSQTGVAIAWAGTVGFDLAAGDYTNGNEGEFIYGYYRGTLSYVISGTVAGCTWSGAGTYTPKASDILELEFGRNRVTYTATTQVADDFQPLVTVTCPAPAPPITIPLTPAAVPGAGVWLATGLQRVPLPGLTTLEGFLAPGEGPGGLRWKWNLKAEG